MKKIFTLAIITAITACTKHANDIYSDFPTANIIIFEPTSGAVFHTGDSINIQALAIASATIHGYDMAVKKGNDTTTYFFQHVHDHNDTIMVNGKWKNNIPSQTRVEVELTFYLDHEGHTAVKRTPVTIQ